MTVREIRHTDKLNVFLDIGKTQYLVGTLAWSDDQRLAYFQLAADFPIDKIPISPLKIKSQNDLIAGSRNFEGLHSTFNDSLPDGWGRLLLDRMLKQNGYDARLITPLDRLTFVGQRGMGALKYIPEKTIKNETSDAIDLDELAQQARSIESDETVADVTKLFAANGGSAGARPKIVAGYNSETAHFQRDIETGFKPGFEPWIIKFRSIRDPLEIAREEYAYALMAKRAGVEMPNVQLLTSKNDAYFAVKRFDRTENNGRRHVLTMSALLDVDHHAAGAVDYSTLMKLTLRLSSNAQHVDQMFRRMVFNVFAHNRDDHAKNHAFIMSEHGQWAPSPAYDITFSTGPGGQHNLDIAGEGLRPGPSHILAVAKQIGTIKENVAQQIIDEVRSAITEWPTIAKDAGLSSKRSREIAMVINPSVPRPRIKRGGKDPTD